MCLAHATQPSQLKKKKKEKEKKEEKQHFEIYQTSYMFLQKCIKGLKVLYIGSSLVRAFAAVELKSYNAILAPPI